MGVGPAAYRFRLELVPEGAPDGTCQAASIVVADVLVGTPGLGLGVRSRAAGSTWAAWDDKALLAEAPFNMAVEVGKKHITWFRDAKPVFTLKGRRAQLGVALVPRLSLVGQQEEMNGAQVDSDWQRAFSLDRGTQVKKGRPLEQDALHRRLLTDAVRAIWSQSGLTRSWWPRPQERACSTQPSLQSAQARWTRTAIPQPSAAQSSLTRIAVRPGGSVRDGCTRIEAISGGRSPPRRPAAPLVVPGRRSGRGASDLVAMSGPPSRRSSHRRCTRHRRHARRLWIPGGRRRLWTRPDPASLADGPRPG